MTYPQLLVRIAPMYIIPWIRTTVGVLLPGMIVTYDLSISQAGLVTIGLEAGNVATMVMLSGMLDRLGPARVIVWGLPVIAGGLVLTAFMADFGGLFAALLLVGAGIALTSSGVNAMIADTGERRGVYLGILHSGFSAFAIVTPLAAGALLVWTDWQSYYLMVAVLAVGILLIFTAAGPKKSAHTVAARSPFFRGIGHAMPALTSLCLGVFAMTGIQGMIISWSYLYMIDIHQSGHGGATLAPALFWVGILIGRSTNIWFQERWSARAILTVSALLSMLTLGVEYLLASALATYVMLVLLGIGVSGAFQLGTAWAADLIPGRIGTASTFVMMSAALGIGVWPWITGLVIDATSFHALSGMVLAGLITAGAMFGITRQNV